MIAGLFVSFSTFMMKALSSLERSEGVRAMQAINRLIVRPSFLLVFMGTALHRTFCWALRGWSSAIDDPVQCSVE